MKIETSKIKSSQTLSSFGSNIIEALVFPDINLAEFKRLPFTAQRSIISRNRIINTDTYNRTMQHLSSSTLQKTDPVSDIHATTKNAKATFSLQMRRSPFPYLVSCGIEDKVEELTLIPISRAELSFAKEYYKETKVPFFNETLWQSIIENNGGHLPFEIYGVRDGTILLPGETMLTVKGHEEIIAHFEHVFHRTFYQTLVATRAHALIQIIKDPNRFVEVGKRASITEEQHLDALKALYIGGGIKMTSNDAGVIMLPIRDTGTIGHRYVQRFTSEEAAFRHAIESLDKVTLLVDLVDTYQGILLALKLKQEYRHTNKVIWLRLDSGDILDQVRFFLRETEKIGFKDPQLDKVIVEGIDSLEEIRDIEQMLDSEFEPSVKERVVYGAGGLMVSSQTSRADASTGFKLAEFSDQHGNSLATMKFSNSPGKISYPGVPRLAIVEGKRTIMQEGETPSGSIIELFDSLYVNNIPMLSDNSMDEARQRLLEQTQLLGLERLSPEQITMLRAVPSTATTNLINKIQARYGINTN
jgi:putative nicotinate phosphoribosyltransferase